METNLIANEASRDDAQLVALGVAGNRDAFGQLVARYQNLICALAYSACGNVAQSEDLAQETFIVAWRSLGDLREPAKFESWLYGIARNLIRNSFRRQNRNPLAGAEPLAEDLTTSAALSNPARLAMSREEEGILWRSLEEIPEIYREPLVLFYREQQSIERVAAIMELSEEAARQRLSRGRKLLQEQVLAFVEGALARSNPGETFTLGVMAGLPSLATAGKATGLGAAAAKGGATAGGGFLGALGATVFPLLAFLNLFGVWRISHKAARSGRERKLYALFFPVLAGSIVVVVMLMSWLMADGGAMAKTNPSLFAGLMAAATFGYPLLLLPFCVWFYRSAKKLHLATPAAEAPRWPQPRSWEYRSQLELLGLPFIHIRRGGWQRGQPMREFKPVKAWIAVDDAFAFGVLFAYGAVAVAPVSIGACAFGLLSYGAMAVGVLPVGGFALGVWAFGGFAFGWQVSAGCAIAWNLASGAQYAIAHQYALAPIAHAAQVNTDFVQGLVKASPFFRVCWKLVPYFFWLMWLWAVPMMISMVSPWWKMAAQWRRTKTTL